METVNQPQREMELLGEESKGSEQPWKNRDILPILKELMTNNILDKSLEKKLIKELENECDRVQYCERETQPLMESTKVYDVEPQAASFDEDQSIKTKKKIVKNKYSVSPDPSMFYATAKSMIEYLNPEDYPGYKVPQGYQRLKFRGFACKFQKTVGFCRNYKSCCYYHSENDKFPKICLDFGITGELYKNSLDFWDFEIQAIKIFSADTAFYGHALKSKFLAKDVPNDERMPRSTAHCFQMVEKACKQFSDIIDGSEHTKYCIRTISQNRQLEDSGVITQFVRDNIKSFDLCVKIFYAIDYINLVIKPFIYFAFVSYICKCYNSNFESTKFLEMAIFHNKRFSPKPSHRSFKSEDIEEPSQVLPAISEPVATYQEESICNSGFKADKQEIMKEQEQENEEQKVEIQEPTTMPETINLQGQQKMELYEEEKKRPSEEVLMEPKGEEKAVHTIKISKRKKYSKGKPLVCEPLFQEKPYNPKPIPPKNQKEKKGLARFKEIREGYLHAGHNLLAKIPSISK